MQHALAKKLGFAFTLAFIACGGSEGPTTPADNGNPPDNPAVADTVRIALTELRGGTYRGFEGGLYPGGGNELPKDHGAAGTAQAHLIRPLDGSGNPTPSGKIVLISIGMSNTTQEFCGGSPCTAWSFIGLAASDSAVNRTTLALVDGARGGQTAGTWDSPTDANYDLVRDNRLSPRGLTERQVQIAWVKLANAGPRSSLPAANADAYLLERQLGDVVRALKVRYPNLRQVFLSSRIYAGYATTSLNPEPYAYESGLSVKWLISAQIAQARGAVADERAGNLDHASGVAPWLAWGPYLWAAGAAGRSDGLIWVPADFAADGTHPSRTGQEKVARLLLAFFKTSAQTRCWFLAGQSCS